MMSRLIPLLMIIGAIGLFFGYVQPTYTGSVASFKTEIEEFDRALEAATRFKQKEAALAAERASIPAEQLARLESFLPDSVDNVQLIVDMNSLAARSGVELSDFNIEGGSETTQSGTSATPVASAAPTTMSAGRAPLSTSASGALPLNSGDATESLELSVSATGSYAAFRTFLAGVETSLRPLDIVELSVSDSDTGVYTYDVTFRLYWLQ